MELPVLFRQYLRSVKLIALDWKLRRRAKKHIGTRYECPLCGFRSSDLDMVGYESPVAKKYKTVGMHLRSGMCWRCLSKERERMLFLYLRDVLHIFDGGSLRILHIAPETMTAHHILAEKNIDYVCGDLFVKGYDYPPYVHNMNVLDLPFADEEFDIVICSHVLEHIEDDRKAMRELCRVLKKGGTGFLQVPMAVDLDKTIENLPANTPEDRLRLYGQNDHVRLYGLDYKDRLEECGFNVELFKFPADLVSRYGLNEDEALYISHKSK